MKKEELFDLLNDIDDGYIAEAEEYRKAKRAKIDTRIIRYIGIAASVILVAGILGILLMNMGGRSTSPQSTSAATTADRSAEATEAYETTYASESYETTECEPTTTLPTDGSGDQIEQPVVMYNGMLYKMSDDDIKDELPEGFEQVGMVIGYDPDHLPATDFYAAGPDIAEGQKIYAYTEDPNVIYVGYDIGEGKTGYRMFTADGI